MYRGLALFFCVSPKSFFSKVFFRFQPSMADATAVALALMDMATPQRPTVRAMKDSNDGDAAVAATHDTPMRCFKLAQVKRTREDLVTLVYSTGRESMEIPFARGEDASVFFQRRAKAARLLFDATRKDVYCTWRKELVSIMIQSPAWVLFKESLQQKRYACGSIQLVITRFTCCQWKEVADPCRNCCNRSWRVGCQKPTYLYHLLPMQRNAAQMEADLSMFEPLSVQRDASAWMKRVPTIACR